MNRLAALALTAGLALGGASLVRAQQNGDSIGALLQGSGRLPPQKPADEAAPAADGDARAGSQDPDADAASDSSTPAAPTPAKPAEPLKRPRFAVAVIQALDKVTTETVRFEVPVNQPVRYKSLIFTVNACETTAADEDQSDAIAHMEIDSQPMLAGQGVAPGRQVFRGWMFANSPGLHLFQHPIYDAWLIACKTASPPA